MISRRGLLAASAVALATPSVVRAQASRVLKFIPQSDLTVIDPVWTTAYNTRNHGYMVFDTLFGMDANYRIQPQMLAGVRTEDLALEIRGRHLILAGVRRSERSLGRSYQQMEIETGPFRREVELAMDIDPAAARASFTDGMLVVEMHGR